MLDKVRQARLVFGLIPRTRIYNKTAMGNRRCGVFIQYTDAIGKCMKLVVCHWRAKIGNDVQRIYAFTILAKNKL